MSRAPLCIDLYSGLGGWAEGFLAEGYDVFGFDIERHRYPSRALPESDGRKTPYDKVDFSNLSGSSRERSFNYANECALRESPLTGGWDQYPGQLVIQDVLTLHGSQFRNATIIVCSPPCQNYSYLAMPWSRSKSEHSQKAKAMRRKWETEGPDNRLFDACFRIQREAIEATRTTCRRCDGKGSRVTDRSVRLCLEYGDPMEVDTCPDCGGKGYTGERYIPLIVENVRGAIPWVGRSAWNYGSFHLWGDVPALMPINLKRGKGAWNNHTAGVLRRDDLLQFGDGQKVPGFRFDGSGRSFQSASVEEVGAKGRTGGGRFGDGKNGDTRKSDPRDVRKQADGSRMTPDGTKIGGDWFSDPQSTCRKHGSRSNARKMASAHIAKIPFPLAQHIAQVYKPRASEAAA